MHSKVSIIIPTYNSQDFIEETIKSCVNQTYSNIDIVVTDDCSNDDTRKILSLYRGSVRVILNDINQGIVKNINSAVNNIDSEYFILLGHDDVLPENHVVQMLSELNEGVVAVHCNSMVIDANGNELGFSRDNKTQKIKTTNAMFELSLDNFISSCGMLHKTSVFQKINGWDESYLHYGEWLYYIKSLAHGKIKYTTKTHAYYRRHDTNITNTFKDKDVVKKLNDYKDCCRQLAHKNNKNSILEIVKYIVNILKLNIRRIISVSYTHLTLPTKRIV